MPTNMTKIKCSVAGLMAVALWTMLPQAHAEGIVTISDPWVRATVPGQQATGAFMKITAHQPVRLVAGATPVAPVVEIHEMKMVKDRMEMRALEQGLPIAAGQTVELKPGGYHVMLINLPKPIEEGQEVPLTLVFQDEKGKRHEVTITAPAKPLAAMLHLQEHQQGHGHKHEHEHKHGHGHGGEDGRKHRH